MVGDSVNDIAPARALGMRAIAVAWGLVPEDSLREAAPHALVHDAAGLLAALGGGRGAG
jgi:phosphoglycolate phosphatase-like HAD superfamily hydrolase